MPRSSLSIFCCSLLLQALYAFARIARDLGTPSSNTSYALSLPFVPPPPASTSSSTPSLPPEVVSTSVTTYVTTVIVTAVPTSKPSVPFNTPFSVSFRTPSSISTFLLPSATLLPLPQEQNSVFTSTPGALASLLGLSLILTIISIWVWLIWRRHQLRQLEREFPNEKFDDLANLDAFSVRPGITSILNGERRVVPGISTVEGGTVNRDIDADNGSSAHDGSWVVCRGPGGALDSGYLRSPFLSDDEAYIAAALSSSNGHDGTSSSQGHWDPSCYEHCSLPHSQNSSQGHLISSRVQDIPSSEDGFANKLARSPSVSIDPAMGQFMKIISESDLIHGFNRGPSSTHSQILASPGLPDSPQSYGPPYAFISQPIPAVLNPPSSLLRPPSTIRAKTLPIPSSLHSSVYMHQKSLKLEKESIGREPSPAMSQVSVWWGREGLLNPLPSPAAESFSSLRDEVDYSRRISKIVHDTTDSFGTAESIPDQEGN